MEKYTTGQQQLREADEHIHCTYKKGKKVCSMHSMKEDILNVIENAISCLNKGNIYALQEESNHIIHCAAIFQKKEAIQTAIVIYALAKMLTRGKTITNEIKDALQKARDFMKYDNVRGFNTEMKNTLRMISIIDDHVSEYMQHVITEAKIKKGSRIYEHGISLRQTAEIFGLSQWELMKYIGKTKASEYVAETVPIKERIAFTRGLFSK